jgi:hypothetical protein
LKIFVLIEGKNFVETGSGNSWPQTKVRDGSQSVKLLFQEQFFEETSSEKTVSKQEVWKQFFRLSGFFIQSKVLQGIKWGSEIKQKEVNEK